MPFFIVEGDRTKICADAIASPAKRRKDAAGCIDRVMCLAAGEERIRQIYRVLADYPPGEGIITPAFGLPAKYVVYVIEPVWQGGQYGEDKVLYKAYQSALKLAWKQRCTSISFPLLSVEESVEEEKFPENLSMQIAVRAIYHFLEKCDMTVYLVVKSRNVLPLLPELVRDVEWYIRQNYCEEDPVTLAHILKTPSAPEVHPPLSALKPLPASAPKPQAHPSSSALKPLWDITLKPAELPATEAVLSVSRRRLDELVNHLDESFSQMLLRLIDERGLKDSVVYKKANVDRRHFSKIRNDVHYTPTKKTVFSFAVALELSLDETKDLMNTAGYSISRSSRFDVIVSFFLENHRYNIFEINEVLFSYGEALLGG